MSIAVPPPSTTSAGIADGEVIDWELFRQSFENSCTIISRYRTLRSMSRDENQQRVVKSITTSSRDFIEAVGESTIAAEDTNMICSDVLRYFELKGQEELTDDEKFGAAVEKSANTACQNSTLIHNKFRAVRQKLFEVAQALPKQRAIAAGVQDPAVFDNEQPITVELSALRAELEEALKYAEILQQSVDGLVKWWQHVKTLARNLRSGPATNSELPEQLREILSRKKWEKLRDASSDYIFQINTFSDQNKLGFTENLSPLPTPIDEGRSRFRSRVWSTSGLPTRLSAAEEVGIASDLIARGLEDGTQAPRNEDLVRRNTRDTSVHNPSTPTSTAGFSGRSDVPGSPRTITTLATSIPLTDLNTIEEAKTADLPSSNVKSKAKKAGCFGCCIIM